MRFVSTRADAPALGFCDTVLAGLATDGGLYVPQTWPTLSSAEIAAFANKPFAAVAFDLISRFVGDEIPAADLRRMIEAAYAGFRHPSTAPVLELEPGPFILELFHGPTLAFKDVAMQFLARVMDHVLTARGERATIIGATSGDTGSAAIEAFRGRDNLDIFILHPLDRTSEVQRRQMTTVLDTNVHNIALRGTFDDCQAIVKTLFNDKKVRAAARLSGVNSINWGRIVAQVTYYFTAAVALGAPHRKVSFTVPTGNFGDIFAGFVAKKMGLPIERLIIATNENDILARTLETGRYETGAVTPTMSPSMDIQVSSNFERLLFEAMDRDGQGVARLMQSLGQSGAFAVPAPALAAIRRDFAAGRASETETADTIADVQARSAYVLDPHTAVGVAVARRHRTDATPMVTLSTAHPAKFPAAVKAAAGIDPALPLWLSDLFDRPERYDVLDNDAAAVAAAIAAKSRAWEA